MMDWLGKMIGLPEEFLACSGGKGGGVIQGTASEATLVALLGAKARAIHKVKKEHPDWKDADIAEKLVGYTSSKYFEFRRFFLTEKNLFKIPYQDYCFANVMQFFNVGILLHYIKNLSYDQPKRSERVYSRR